MTTKMVPVNGCILAETLYADRELHECPSMYAARLSFRVVDKDERQADKLLLQENMHGERQHDSSLIRQRTP